MSKHLKAIAIDDEFRALEVIERYVDKIDFIEWCGSFKKALEGLSASNLQEVDLVFLDINMPEISGVALAKLLKPHQQVIFTTAYSNYAVEGFTLNATDYLLKPIEFDRFLQACLKARELFESRSDSKETNASTAEALSIKSGTRIERIKPENILFFEKLGNNMLIHLEKGDTISTRMNMKELFDLVPESQFCQVHKSFVVALDKINTIESHQVKVKDKEVPVGRSYKEALLRRL